VSLSPTDTPDPAPEQPTATLEPPTATHEQPTATPTSPPADTPEPTADLPSDTPEPPGATVTTAPTETPVPADSPEPTASPQGFALQGVGFSTPESILYDPEADLYLVANINGDPAAKDGNGFISRVSPSGELLALRWIDGQAEGMTLNAPKGMAVSGQVLYVADIDTIRLFDRGSGAPVGEVVIAGAVFLNDVAAAGDGTIYVTDSATGLVHMVSPDGSFEQLEGVQLDGPNGIFVADQAILVTAGGGLIVEVGSGGQVTPLHQAPAGGLDGLIVLDDGSILVSSWQGSAVYLIDSVGQASELFAGVDAPADIGFDTARRLVLIPRFQDDLVEARPLP
jgi:hypothetical protein